MAASVLIGIASAIATESIRANAMWESIRFDKQFELLQKLTSQVNGHFSSVEIQVEKLQETAEQFLYSIDSGTFNKEEFLSFSEEIFVQSESIVQRTNSMVVLLDTNLVLFSAVFDHDVLHSQSLDSEPTENGFLKLADLSYMEKLNERVRGSNSRAELAVNTKTGLEYAVQILKRMTAQLATTRSSMNEALLEVAKSLRHR